MSSGFKDECARTELKDAGPVAWNMIGSTWAEKVCGALGERLTLMTHPSLMCTISESGRSRSLESLEARAHPRVQITELKINVVGEPQPLRAGIHVEMAPGHGR